MKTTKFIFLNVDKNPSEIELNDGVVYVCRGDKWAALLCPCGCGDTLHLSLMEGVKPCWTITDKTISPSINKLTGCRSHFFIKNGLVC